MPRTCLGTNKNKNINHLLITFIISTFCLLLSSIQITKITITPDYSYKFPKFCNACKIARPTRWKWRTHCSMTTQRRRTLEDILLGKKQTNQNPWRHPPGKKQTNQNPWTSPIGERDQKEKRPTRNLMANIDQSYWIHQARRDLPPIGQKAYFQQKSHINKEFIGCYQQCKKYIFIFYIEQTLIGVSN